MNLADTIQNDRLLARTLQIQRERDEKAAQTLKLDKPTPVAAAPVVLAVPVTAAATREATLRAIAEGFGAEQRDLTAAIREGLSTTAFISQESDKAVARRESLRRQLELDAVVKSIVDCNPNGRIR